MRERCHFRRRSDAPDDDVIGDVLPRCRSNQQLVARRAGYAIPILGIVQKHEPARPHLDGIAGIAHPCIPCIRGCPAHHEVFAARGVAVDDGNRLDGRERYGVAEHIGQRAVEVQRLGGGQQPTLVMPRAVRLVFAAAREKFVSQVPGKLILRRGKIGGLLEDVNQAKDNFCVQRCRHSTCPQIGSFLNGIRRCCISFELSMKGSMMTLPPSVYE